MEDGEKVIPETKSEKPEKIYTQNEMLIYCGITGLVTAIIGYFIGENRGEKKAKEKFEHAVNKWKSKAGNHKENDSEEEFIL